MRKLQFNANLEPTLGIEIELGLVSEDSMALSNSVQPLLALLPVFETPCYKPELMQSCIEINTRVCRSVSEAEDDLRAKLVEVERAADQLDLRLWWGGTHPFSLCSEQLVTEDERYHGLVELLQVWALPQ